MVMPVISLWMPWANWVVMGWKPIETRLHRRFASLIGREIGIHAAVKWDDQALALARPYLTDQQFEASERFLGIGGAIIGTACCTNFRELTDETDSQSALIDCKNTKRYGLVLAYPKVIPAIPCRGKQGIWYYDIPVAGATAPPKEAE